MSEFHNPEEDFKNLIDNFFKEKEKPQYPSRKLSLPEAPALKESEEKEVVELAMDEMESIRQAFLDFQDAIAETAVYGYLYPHIEEFADIAQHMADLMEDNIDQKDLTDIGKRDYERVREIRNRILNSVKDKYLK